MHTILKVDNFLPFTGIARSRIQWIACESKLDVAYKLLGVNTIIGALGTIAVATRDSLHPRPLETNARTIRLITVAIDITVSVHTGGSDGEGQERSDWGR